jgi:hypothetical protein
MQGGLDSASWRASGVEAWRRWRENCSGQRGSDDVRTAGSGEKTMWRRPSKKTDAAAWIGVVRTGEVVVNRFLRQLLARISGALWELSASRQTWLGFEALDISVLQLRSVGWDSLSLFILV